MPDLKTALLIVLGLILLPAAFVFIQGFIEGFRNYHQPPPSSEDLKKLWYDLVYENPAKPKQKPKYKVLWPPDEGDTSR